MRILSESICDLDEQAAKRRLKIERLPPEEQLSSAARTGFNLQRRYHLYH